MSLWLIFWIGDLIMQLQGLFLLSCILAGTASIVYFAGAKSDEIWGKDSSSSNRLAFKLLFLCFIFAVLASLMPSGRTISIAQTEYIAQMPTPKKMIARAANWLDASFLPEREK